jgi:hypothetical protein
VALVSFYLSYLLYAALVTPPLEAPREERIHDGTGELSSEDAASYGEHVGVVVLARETRGVLVETQRGPDAVHLVGRDLLPLAAAPEHDPEIGLAPDDGVTDGRAERWVIDRLHRVRTEVDHLVSLPNEVTGDADLQVEAGVVGSESDLHVGIL